MSKHHKIQRMKNMTETQEFQSQWKWLLSVLQCQDFSWKSWTLRLTWLLGIGNIWKLISAMPGASSGKAVGYRCWLECFSGLSVWPGGKEPQSSQTSSTVAQGYKCEFYNTEAILTFLTELRNYTVLFLPVCYLQSTYNLPRFKGRGHRPDLLL